MRDFLVYLAGPISGLTLDHGQSWRDYVKARLPQEIRGMSPLRGKQDLARVGIIDGSYEDNPLATSRGLTNRDRMDCTRADAIIMNLLGAKRITIGTMIEIGWADINRIPIILVMEKTGNPHDHPMVRECASFRLESLDEAISVVEAVLLPEGEGTPRDNFEARIASALAEPEFKALAVKMADVIQFDPNFGIPLSPDPSELQ